MFHRRYFRPPCRKLILLLLFTLPFKGREKSGPREIVIAQRFLKKTWE
jgi:hypothetical protein